MDERQRIIAQAAPPPPPDPMLAAVLRLGEQVAANNSKMDGLVGDVAAIKTSVDGVQADIKDVQVRLNGDGTPEHRGWVGMILDLQAQMKQQDGFLGQLKQWGTVPVTVALTVATTLVLTRIATPLVVPSPPPVKHDVPAAALTGSRRE